MTLVSHRLGGEIPHIPHYFLQYMNFDEYGKGAILWGVEWDAICEYCDTLPEEKGDWVLLIAQVTSELFVLLEGKVDLEEYADHRFVAFPSWMKDMEALTMALQCHAVWFDWWGTWGLHIYSKGVVIASDSGGSEYDCFDESLIEQNLQDEEIPETQSPTKIEDVPEIVATSRFFDIPLKNYFCIVLDEDDVAEIDRLPYDVLSGFFNDIGIPGELYRFCGKILLSNIRSVPRQNPFSSFRFYICGLDSKTPHQPQHPKSATNDQQD